MDVGVDDYAAAAAIIGCETRMVHALATKEGRNHGFDHWNRPTILYEPTHFARYSHHAKQYRRMYPDLTMLAPPPHRYGPDSLQWKHLQAAYLINPRAALLAPSWGKFQILASNFRLAGYVSVETFVSAMCTSEQIQLAAFVSFIQSIGAAQALKNKNWDMIADKYNGSQKSGSPYAKSLEDIYDALGN